MSLNNPEWVSSHIQSIILTLLRLCWSARWCFVLFHLFSLTYWQHQQGISRPYVRAAAAVQNRPFICNREGPTGWHLTFSNPPLPLHSPHSPFTLRHSRRTQGNKAGGEDNMAAGKWKLWICVHRVTTRKRFIINCHAVRRGEIPALGNLWSRRRFRNVCFVFAREWCDHAAYCRRNEATCRKQSAVSWSFCLAFGSEAFAPCTCVQDGVNSAAGLLSFYGHFPMSTHGECKPNTVTALPLQVTNAHSHQNINAYCIRCPSQTFYNTRTDSLGQVVLAMLAGFWGFCKD